MQLLLLLQIRVAFLILSICKLVHMTELQLERGIVDDCGFNHFQFDFHKANSGAKGKKEFGRPWSCTSR
jgi:hypothetical protein